jgi:hypothetical protein
MQEVYIQFLLFYVQNFLFQQEFVTLTSTIFFLLLYYIYTQNEQRLH